VLFVHDASFLIFRSRRRRRRRRKRKKRKRARTRKRMAERKENDPTWRRIERRHPR
jgi:hypothetical protein